MNKELEKIDVLLNLLYIMIHDTDVATTEFLSKRTTALLNKRKSLNLSAEFSNFHFFWPCSSLFPQFSRYFRKNVFSSSERKALIILYNLLQNIKYMVEDKVD